MYLYTALADTKLTYKITRINLKEVVCVCVFLAYHTTVVNSCPKCF